MLTGAMTLPCQRLGCGQTKQEEVVEIILMELITQLLILVAILNGQTLPGKMLQSYQQHQSLGRFMSMILLEIKMLPKAHLEFGGGRT
jgi:hypothetical protein